MTNTKIKTSLFAYNTWKLRGMESWVGDNASRLAHEWKAQHYCPISTFAWSISHLFASRAATDPWRSCHKPAIHTRRHIVYPMLCTVYPDTCRKKPISGTRVLQLMCFLYFAVFLIWDPPSMTKQTMQNKIYFPVLGVLIFRWNVV